MLKNLILAIITLVAVIFVILYFQIRTENAKIRIETDHLLKGDNISSFDLIGINTNDVTLSDIEDIGEKISAIFIYNRPCSTCCKNNTYWNKLYSVYKNKISVYGIILETDKSNVLNFAESGIVRFDLYIPRSLEKIIETFQIRVNLPQTILYKNGKIIYLKLGYLSSSDYFEISKIIKGDVI